MKLINSYPTPAFAFQQYNTNSELAAVVTVKGTYEIAAGNSLRFMAEQPEIALDDTFTGPEDPPAHLVHLSDFVPFKPGTDVTVLARSYAPSGKPEQSWLTGLKVGDIEHVLRVYGPRFWEPVEGQQEWEMGEAEPAAHVPLSYYQAFGGLIPRDEKSAEGLQDSHPYNPLGPGVLLPEHSVKGKRYAAPQIEAVDDPILDWRKDYEPKGFAPVAPVWRFREQYTGTYDEIWLRTRHPFLPPDFECRFYNCAHPDLIFSPFLQGDETIQLVNMHLEHKHMTFTLPALKLEATATFKEGSGKSQGLNLDGVHIDLLQDGPPRLTLTWRTAFAWQSGVKEIALEATRRVKAERSASTARQEELA
ncbi:DUF2169 family type VI secretion system accessory protein [Pseudovibrio ascidiaceicola]|uniref:DUF2169 family type VI secretion system accessory protein n=1 Tax=Pseudovibrio ascidiaceicola TaxID=285279 RepID=UPI003D36E33D